jgi:hypothetical protein
MMMCWRRTYRDNGMVRSNVGSQALVPWWFLGYRRIAGKPAEAQRPTDLTLVFRHLYQFLYPIA